MPVKLDPKYLKAARELRDRWLERVNDGQLMLSGAGKYDVVRTLANPIAPARPVVLLPQAA